MGTDRWNGFVDAESDIGDGMALVENVSFVIGDELGRRPGFGAKIVDSGWVAGEVGSYAILARSDGKINAVHQTTGVSATLATGYSVTNRPVMAQALQRLYITNNVDAMKVTDDGTSIRGVGIVGPTVVPTVAIGTPGTIDIGTRLIRYRYQDQTRTRLSNPSDLVSFTIGGGVGVASINGTGGVSAIAVVVGGSHYPAAPAVTLIGGGGTGATATATLTAGVITSFSVTAAGTGYTSIPQVLIADATGGKLTVTPTASGDANVTHIIIEMTPAGASTFYRAAIIVNASTATDIVMSDISLVQQVPATRDGEFQHLPPPITPMVLEHRNRIFWWGQSTQTELLGWSRAGFPESFDSINYARLINLDSGDSPAAMASYYTDLYLFGQRSMRRLVFTSDPATGMLLTVPGTMGAYHQRCVCTAGAGLLFGWGRDGMWRINAMQPEKISQNIEQSMATLIDSSKIVQRFVVYEPIQREVAFFFVATGDASCKLAFVWHIEQQQWSLWRFRQGIQAGCPNSAYVDRQRVMLCDANGYSWRMFGKYNDGATGDGRVTALVGSTTTVVQGINSAIVGQTLYRPATAEERLITGASGSTITVAALATAPSIGELLYVGSIRQRYLTQWFVMEGMADRKRPPRLLLTVRPNNLANQGMGLVQVYFYRDWSLTASSIGTGYATDVNYSGVTTASTYVQIDLDAAMADTNAAFLSLPTPAEWARVWQVEIIAESPRDGVRMYEIEMEMDTRGAAGPGQEG